MPSQRVRQHRKLAAVLATEMIWVHVRRKSSELTRWSDQLGTAMAVPAVFANPADIPRLAAPVEGLDLQVSRAIVGAARRLPFSATCLDQAVTAQRFLNRHQIPVTIVIGAKTNSHAELHAWAVSPNGMITGGPAGLEYQPVSCFVPDDWPGLPQA